MTGYRIFTFTFRKLRFLSRTEVFFRCSSAPLPLTINDSSQLPDHFPSNFWPPENWIPIYKADNIHRSIISHYSLMGHQWWRKNVAKNPRSREEGGEGGICAQITMNAVYAVVLFNWWQVYEGGSNISSRATLTTYIRIDLRLRIL